jgi:enoyl-[acyl-carrier protein] reductase I
MSDLTATEKFFADLKKRVEGPQGALAGKKALVIGIANNQSIAYGCALAFRALGAELAVTHLNEKSKKYTQVLADRLEAPLHLPCDVREEGQMEAVFESIEQKWGKLDIALHSIAFAPREDLHGRVTDCSRDGFLMAMDISCYSFVHMAKLAEPLMKDGGTLFTMSYYGAEKVVENYNVRRRWRHRRDTFPPSSDRRGSGFMRSRLALFRHARRRASTASTS